MNPLNKKSGFTLIELLVVISIIGLLSSIVLAALNNAKLKAQDARVMSDMVNLRTAAEMYYSSNGYYWTQSWPKQNYFDSNNESDTLSYYTPSFLDTGADGGGYKIFNDVLALSYTKNDPSANRVSVKFSGQPTQTYAISALLPSTLNGAQQYVCIDSSGAIKIEKNYNNSSNITAGFVAACF